MATKLHGIFGELEDLQKKAAREETMYPSERAELDDLSVWANTYVQAFERAMGLKTYSQQSWEFLLNPDNQNNFILAFGGFAGVGANGLKIERAIEPVGPEQIPPEHIGAPPEGWNPPPVSKPKRPAWFPEDPGESPKPADGEPAEPPAPVEPPANPDLIRMVALTESELFALRKRLKSGEQKSPRTEHDL